MSAASDLWRTTAITGSAVAETSPAGAAATERADIFIMTQTAEDAVLKPSAPGSWPHDLRAALAARVAALNGADELAQRYRAMMQSPDYVPIARPHRGDVAPDIAAPVAFIDAVATAPREITASDIATLRAAGVSDADIVRLTELVAFLSYQVRLVAGLSLLSGDLS